MFKATGFYRSNAWVKITLAGSFDHFSFGSRSGKRLEIVFSILLTNISRVGFRNHNGNSLQTNMPRLHQILNMFKSCLVKHGLKLFSFFLKAAY